MNALLGCERNTKSLKEFKAGLLLREENDSVPHPTVFFHWLYLYLRLLQQFSVSVFSLTNLLNQSFQNSCTLKSIISHGLSHVSVLYIHTFTGSDFAFFTLQLKRIF